MAMPAAATRAVADHHRAKMRVRGAPRAMRTPTFRVRLATDNGPLVQEQRDPGRLPVRFVAAMSRRGARRVAQLNEPQSRQNELKAKKRREDEAPPGSRIKPEQWR